MLVGVRCVLSDGFLEGGGGGGGGGGVGGGGSGSYLKVLKKVFLSCHGVANSLDLDQAQYFVGPNLGPNFSQL